MSFVISEAKGESCAASSTSEYFVRPNVGVRRVSEEVSPEMGALYVADVSEPEETLHCFAASHRGAVGAINLH